MSLEQETDALEAQAAMRLGGHDWDTINNYTYTGRQNSLAVGHAEEDIDQYQGYKPAKPWQGDMARTWKQRLMDDTAITTPGHIRTDYANAIVGRYARDPQDFAAKYMDAIEQATGVTHPKRADLHMQLAAGLPQVGEFIDGALQAMEARGGTLSTEMFKNAVDQLSQEWASSGRSPQDIVTNGPSPPPVQVDPDAEKRKGALTSMLGDELGDHLTSVLPVDGAGLGQVSDFIHNLIGGEKKEGEPDKETLSQKLIRTFGKIPQEWLRVQEQEGESAVAAQPFYHDYINSIPTQALHAVDEVNSAFRKGDLVGLAMMFGGATAAMGKVTAAAARTARVTAMNANQLDNARSIEDALNIVRRSNEADKLDAMRFVSNKIPAKFIDQDLLTRVRDDVEQRLVKSDHEFTPETKEFLTAFKPITDMEHDLTSALRNKLSPEARAAIGLDQPTLTIEQGYTHRMLDRNLYLGGLDPDASRIADVVTGAMPNKSLSTFAPGTQGRKFYVLEDAEGGRSWSPNTLDDAEKLYGKPIKYEDTVTSVEGTQYEVRQPTTREIEQNATDSRGNALKFRENIMANTLDNVLRLARVNRNVDLLDRLKVDLTASNQLIQTERYINATTKVRIAPDPTEGDWVELKGLPQMEGMWVPQRIAEPLMDFYKTTEPGVFWQWLEKANRFLIGAMFATPFPHIANVGAHWMVGRGIDWVTIQGWSHFFSSWRRALVAVRTLNQDYTDMLREGSGLLRGSMESENFYGTMMKNLFDQQLKDEAVWGPVAQKLGFESLRKMVAAEYNWSRRTLWHANDVLMLQRQFELEARGMTKAAAIKMAEKDIPNYRIPSRVGMDNKLGRVLSEFMSSPNAMNFGRYKYGQIKALTNIVSDLAGGTGKERLDAVAKVLILGSFSMFFFPMLDRGLQFATGNPYAHVPRPGPFSLIDAMYQMTPGQRDWGQRVGALVNPSPAISMMFEARQGKDEFTRPLVDPNSTALGMGTQGAEWLGSHFYPLGLAEEIMRGHIGGAIGKATATAILPDQDAQARALKAQRYKARDARTRERNSKLEQFLRSIGM